MGVVRDSRIPLYQQIYDDLREQIESGQFHPGDQIPTEAQLSQAYGVSKITVKQALQLLVQEGVLERIQGKGTFVCQPKVDRMLKGVISFRDEMLQRGMKPGAHLLDLRVVPASPKIANRLHLLPMKDVIKIQRLRSADDEVMGLQNAYIPYDLCPELLRERDRLENGSLYELLGEVFSLRPARAEETYSIVRADLHDAQLMGIREGDPVFYVERVSFLSDGSPIEVVFSLLRGDRYTLHVDLMGG